MTSHTDHPMRHWDRTCPACNEGASMTDREAMKMALDALENTATRRAAEQYVIEQHAIAFLKQTLANTKQEPVAWMASDNKDIVYASEFDGNKKSRFNIPLFTAPLKSKFVRLTDEEKDLIACHAAENDWHDYEVINAAEARLKEKNA